MKRAGRFRVPVGKRASEPDAVPVRKQPGRFKTETAVRVSSHWGTCEQCAGRMHGETWLHAAGCSRTVVFWKSHGLGWLGDWPCPHRCHPVELASCYTHPWDCPFWSTTEETPF